ARRGTARRDVLVPRCARDGGAAMNAFDVEEAIQEALVERDENHADLHGEPQVENHADLHGEPQVFARIVTYADAGVLTRDAGLLVRTASGDEFQVTIIRTRHGRNAEDDE